MSASKTKLVTCCPVCSANFYVSPDQLSAHHGEVRCGKCSHVFNALDRLSELSGASVTEVVTTNEVTQLVTEQEKVTASQLDEPEIRIEKTSASNISDHGALLSSSSTTSPKIKFDLASKNKLNRPGKRKSHHRIFLFLALVLAIMATAQAAYFLRSEIASRWPVLKPYLAQACDLLGCTIELPKQIDLMAIDDSDLQEDAEHQGLIHLSSTIINNASFIQAYPLLEVTLTDNYDKPILRRAFTPAEYLPKGTNLRQGMRPNEEIRIELGLSASNEPVAGYRVFVTYPQSNENH
jgi:predicted Zn finger-like uncharacterized protein